MSDSAETSDARSETSGTGEAAGNPSQHPAIATVQVSNNEIAQLIAVFGEQTRSLQQLALAVTQQATASQASQQDTAQAIQSLTENLASLVEKVSVNPASRQNPAPPRKPVCSIDVVQEHWPDTISVLVPTKPDEAYPRVIGSRLTLLDKTAKKLEDSKNLAKLREYCTVVSCYGYGVAYLEAFRKALARQFEEDGDQAVESLFGKYFNGLEAALELSAKRAALIQSLTLKDNYDHAWVAFMEALIENEDNKDILVSPEIAKSFERFQQELNSKLLATYAKLGASHRKITPSADTSTTTGTKPDKIKPVKQPKKPKGQPSDGQA